MKTSKNVSHICATWGLCGIYHICKIPEVLLFSPFVALCLPRSPSPMIGLLATENGVVRRFALQFRSQIIIYRHKNDSQEALWCQKHAETS